MAFIGSRSRYTGQFKRTYSDGKGIVVASVGRWLLYGGDWGPSIDLLAMKFKLLEIISNLFEHERVIFHKLFW